MPLNTRMHMMSTSHLKPNVKLDQGPRYPIKRSLNEYQTDRYYYNRN